MKVISVWSPKGGVGKTTIALNIADYLATVQKKRVLVYDTDPQHSLHGTHAAGEFSFECTDLLPENAPDYDYFIADFRPVDKPSKAEIKLLSISHKVVVPSRAARLDLNSAKAVSKYVPDDKRINVLSCFDKRMGHQKDAKEQIAQNYGVVSYLAVYINTVNDFETIFSKGQEKKLRI
jgi:chromosome partitioning protein